LGLIYETEFSLVRLSSRSDAQFEAQLAFLMRLRPLVRGRLPYTVLWQVVKSGDGLDPAQQRQLREEDKNAGRVFKLLEDLGLVEWKRERWVATTDGRGVVRQLEKATDSPPATFIEGRRILAVSADREGGLDAAERILRRATGDVLYAEGKYELVAILPDDFALVADLRARLRQGGHDVIATRIVGSSF
jgi:hypothetical protein